MDHILRCWSDRSPTTRALLHIRIIALRILTIVPEGLRRRLGRLLRSRLDIDLRRRRNDSRRISIRVSIRTPVGLHEWPDGKHNARPDEDTPMAETPSMMEAPSMMKAPSMAEAASMTEARPTTEGIPRYWAGYE